MNVTTYLSYKRIVYSNISGKSNLTIIFLNVTEKWEKKNRKDYTIDGLLYAYIDSFDLEMWYSLISWIISVDEDRNIL